MDIPLLTRAALAVLMAASTAPAQAAGGFAAPGSSALLEVEYSYVSSGRRSSQGMYDPYEWRVERSASIEALLTARPPTARPTVQPIDPVQRAAITGARKDIPGPAPGGPRYQAWRPRMQKGTYAIDERVHISVTDPICTSKPRHRCTREETRKGSGPLPVTVEAKPNASGGAAAGISAAELDAGKGTLTLALPGAIGMLPYTEIITTDEPEGTHDTPTPKGAHKREALFRVSASGSGLVHDKPLTVALKGGWRRQEGEYTVALKGHFGDGGTLTVRWRFEVQ